MGRLKLLYQLVHIKEDEPKNEDVKTGHREEKETECPSSFETWIKLCLKSNPSDFQSSDLVN